MLFCKNGYEQTSIQNILDSLDISKGSFYHHFISKESVLEAVCFYRAEQIYDVVAASINTMNSSYENLNLLLSGMIPFTNEKMSFLLMLIPVFRLPEGKTVRMYYCDAIQSLFRPAVARQLEQGHLAQEIFCPDPDIAADLITALVNRLWTRICEMIINDEEMNEETDAADYLRLVQRYRLSIEQLVSLPYGSIELISLASLRLLSEQIHNHWPRNKHQ